MNLVGFYEGSEIADLSCSCPNSDRYAHSESTSTKQIIGSSVMLTIGKEMALFMNVASGKGCNPLVSERLMCDVWPVANKQIEVKVNGTVVAVVSTRVHGLASANESGISAKHIGSLVSGQT